MDERWLSSMPKLNCVVLDVFFFTVTNPSDLEPICIPLFFLNCYESQINHHELLSKPQNAEKKASWCTMAAAKEINVDTCNSDS